MFNATVSLALSVYFGLATMAGAPPVGSVDLTANIIDYEIVDGHKVSAAGDGSAFLAYHGISAAGDDFTICWDCTETLWNGYDYINYRDVPAHVGDMITTFEFIDDFGEVAGRYDFVSYCPHNN